LHRALEGGLLAADDEREHVVRARREVGGHLDDGDVFSERIGEVLALVDFLAGSDREPTRLEGVFAGADGIPAARTGAASGAWVGHAARVQGGRHAARVHGDATRRRRDTARAQTAAAGETPDAERPARGRRRGLAIVRAASGEHGSRSQCQREEPEHRRGELHG
jgi:hypothetical protein